MAPCFFCLQDSRESQLNCDLCISNSKNEPESVDNLFPLRHISRFLNLFEEDDDNDNDPGNGNMKMSKEFKRKLLQFAKDSAISVCEDCSKMMKEFTELYHVMGVTKLRLNWCVQRMHHVMKKNVKAKKNGSPFLGNESNENLWEVMRTKMMDRIMLKDSLPRVVLHETKIAPRIELGPGSSEQSSSNVPTSLFPPDLDFDASITNLVSLLVPKPNKTASAVALKSTSSRIVKYPKKAKAKATSIQSQSPSIPVPLKKKKSSSSDVSETSLISCAYCRAKFPATLRNQNNYGMQHLHKHMFQYHPQHYFPFLEHGLADTVTDFQFKKILADILFQDLIEGKSSCLYCEKPLTIPSKSSDKIMQKSRTKLHFIEKHYEELEKKLYMIQTDPNLLDKLNVCNPEGRMCGSGCGVYIPKFHFQAMHDKLHCTMTTTGRRKEQKEAVKFTPSQNQPLPSSCPYCRYKCGVNQSSGAMGRHLINFHPQYYVPNEVEVEVEPDQFQRVLHDVLFPELTSVPPEEGTISCGFCGEHFNKYKHRYYNNNALRRHLIFGHKAELSDRLKVILQDPDLEAKLEKVNPDGVLCPCGMYLPNGIAFNLGHHEKFQCNLQGKIAIAEGVEMDVDEGGGGGIQDNLFDEIPSRFLLSSTSCKKNVAMNANTKKKDCGETGESTSTSAKLTLTSCPYCRYVCKAGHASASLSRHLLRFHPQYYFPQVEYQIHGVTSDQFQRVLHDILFPELALTLETGDVGVFSCKFCDFRFKSKDIYNNNVAMRRHLVFSHKTQVTKRLEAVLAEPDLEGRMAVANPIGVSCPCGMYLPSGVGIGFSETYHEKFQCNLKAKDAETQNSGQRGSEGMEIDYEDDDDGRQFQVDLENEEGNFLGVEEYKFNGETIQMTIDRTVNEVFVDESDSFEI